MYGYLKALVNDQPSDILNKRQQVLFGFSLFDVIGYASP
jgi:hypothetical protein